METLTLMVLTAGRATLPSLTFLRPLRIFTWRTVNVYVPARGTRRVVVRVIVLVYLGPRTFTLPLIPGGRPLTLTAIRVGLAAACAA